MLSVMPAGSSNKMVGNSASGCFALCICPFGEYLIRDEGGYGAKVVAHFHFSSQDGCIEFTAPRGVATQCPILIISKTQNL
jgi:hypothetical protein